MAATPLDHLCELFGGAQELARALGVNKSLVTRWRKPKDADPRGLGKNGRLPPAYNARLIEAADAAGISREEIAPHMDAAICECCGRPVPMVRA